MDVPNLPRHVLERAERRWTAVLSRQAALRPAGSHPATQQERSADSLRRPLPKEACRASLEAPD